MTNATRKKKPASSFAGGHVAKHYVCQFASQRASAPRRLHACCSAVIKLSTGNHEPILCSSGSFCKQAALFLPLPLLIRSRSVSWLHAKRVT